MLVKDKEVGVVLLDPGLFLPPVFVPINGSATLGDRQFYFIESELFSVEYLKESVTTTKYTIQNDAFNPYEGQIKDDYFQNLIN